MSKKQSAAIIPYSNNRNMRLNIVRPKTPNLNRTDAVISQISFQSKKEISRALPGRVTPGTDFKK